MSDDPVKQSLRRYLQLGRDALVWKVEGASDYDVRRPVTPTGTNLLGLLKHVAGVEAEYLGRCFDRPFPEQLAWMADDAEDNADMWASPEESREDLVALYRRVQAHGDATLDALPLDAPGEVPWWGEGRHVTLERVVVHLLAENQRHLGHADIVRELVDGAIGLNTRVSNLPDHDAAWWAAYRDTVEQAARTASGVTSGGPQQPQV